MIKANLVNEIPHAVSSNANHKGNLKWELHYKFNLQVKETFKFCVNFQATKSFRTTGPNKLFALTRWVKTLMPKFNINSPLRFH